MGNFRGKSFHLNLGAICRRECIVSLLVLKCFIVTMNTPLKTEWSDRVLRYLKRFLHELDICTQSWNDSKITITKIHYFPLLLLNYTISHSWFLELSNICTPWLAIWQLWLYSDMLGPIYINVMKVLSKTKASNTAK